MAFGFINEFKQSLAADLAAGATTMTLDGGGSLLSNASSDLIYKLTLSDTDGNVEIVHAYGVSGDDITIVRAREGTADQAWSSGTPVELRMTAGAADAFLQSDARIVWGDTTISADPVPEGVVMLGYSGFTTGEGPQVSIGGEVYNYSLHGIAIGTNAINANGDYAIAIGEGGITAARGIALGVGEGENWGTYDQYTMALGYRTQANTPFSIAMGANATANVDGGLRCTGIPYIALEPGSFDPPALTGMPGACLRTGAQVAMSLPVLDLTQAAGTAVDLDLPGFMALYIDSIEFVVVNSSSPGGTPEIKVGTDATNTDTLLGATTLSALTERHRQRHDPLDLDGVVGVRAEIVTAATGTLDVRVIVRGYLLEE